MKLLETKLQGLFLVEGKKFFDERGFFTEVFKKSTLEMLGVPSSYLQDNMSFSKKGVLRGLHLQKAPHAQGKFVRCLKGAIFDVAVDLRSGSKTYGQWQGFELSEDNNHILYIPEGFGHGFQALADDNLVFYKCTKEYSSLGEVGVRYDDAELQIRWPMRDAIISAKDLALGSLQEFTKNNL